MVGRKKTTAETEDPSIPAAPGTPAAALPEDLQTEALHTEEMQAEELQTETVAVEALPVTTVAELAPVTADIGPGNVDAGSVAQKASKTIRNHVLASAATALIPVNFLDIAALVAVQLRLLQQLSLVHDVDFRIDIGRSAVATLLATVAPTALGGAVLSSIMMRQALHSIPLVGPAMRVLTQPAINAAFTYALGKVFDQHFASGGTFLTFDPTKVTEFFNQKFEEARSLGVKDAAAAA